MQEWFFSFLVILYIVCPIWLIIGIITLMHVAYIL